MLTICLAAAGSLPTVAADRDLGVAEPAPGSPRPRGACWPRWTKPAGAARGRGRCCRPRSGRRPGRAPGRWWRCRPSSRPAGWRSVTGSPQPHDRARRPGRCTPDSTLISVDLPAPFWPSRQCTSPAATSRSTPSSARTPGNVLTTPVSRRTRSAHHRSWLAVREFAGEHRGADDAGPGAQLGQDDRQVAGGQRQRAPVDHAADLGQQHVAEAGQPAADDDHRRVDEADQPGQHGADPAAAVADQPDAGRRRPRPRRRRRRAAVTRAVGGEPLGQRRRGARPGRGQRVPGQRRPAEERLEAADVAARADRAVRRRPGCARCRRRSRRCPR